MLGGKSAAVKPPRPTDGRIDLHVRTYLGTGPASRHGLGAQPGIRSFADPCNGFQPGWCAFFPDGIPSGAAAAKTPATSTARDGPYLLVRVRVRPEHDRAQSCAIALRSPASERPSDLNRYSPDIL